MKTRSRRRRPEDRRGESSPDNREQVSTTRISRRQSRAIPRSEAHSSPVVDGERATKTLETGKLAADYHARRIWRQGLCCRSGSLVGLLSGFIWPGLVLRLESLTPPESRSEAQRTLRPTHGSFLVRTCLVPRSRI